MDKLDVTSKMVDYISNNHIAIEQIVRHTNVSENKLKGMTKEKLSTTEFLSLCQYLNVEPEQFV